MAYSSSGAAIKSSIESYLKEDWVLDYIAEQFSREMPLEALLEKTAKHTSGKWAEFAVRLGPNTSTGYRAEMGELPNPSKQVTDQAKATLRYLYTVVAFSGQSMAASKDRAKAIADVVSDELDNAIKDHRKVCNFYNYGDSSGRLAKITSLNGGTTVLTVDRWCPLFQVGRVLDAYTGASISMTGVDSGTGTGVGVITAVSKANKTITMSATTGCVVGDYLYAHGTKDICQMGLLGIVDDGEFVTKLQTIDGSAAGKQNWNSKVLRASAPRNITESLLMDAIALQREDGIKPDLYVGTSFQLKDLCAEAKIDRRFIDDKHFQLGVEGITIGDGRVVFTFDPDCLPGYTFGLVKDDIFFVESAPVSFMDRDGNILSRVRGYDAYDAILFQYRELVARARYSHLRIEDINENRPAGM